MKRILVLPVKNEAWILGWTLACASLWADHIIIADQSSTDGTLEICSRFNKVKVIPNPARFHSSNVRKLLLDEARKIPGPKVIFSFDADELPTTDILTPEFWREVEALPPATSIELLWLNLWRSIDSYRDDASAQGPVFKHFGFIDDGLVDYTNLNVINDHTSRVPPKTLASSRKFESPKVLHYQFANWSRTMSKQAHYRMTEWLQKPQNIWTAIKINLKYASSKDETGLILKDVPEVWRQAYIEQGIGFSGFDQAALSWHDNEALKYFSQYGPKFFSWLDIWDIDWESKRNLATIQGTSNAPKQSLDCQGVMARCYHIFLKPVLNFIFRFYQKVKNSN